MSEKFGIILEREREREKEMRMPKVSTIRGKIHGYAYKAGFTVHPQSGGTYSLFDIHMGYYTHKSVSMDTIVRVVVDTLIAMQRRNESLV